MTSPHDGQTPWRRLDRRVIWLDLVFLVLSLTPSLLVFVLLGEEFSWSSLGPTGFVAVVGVIGAGADALRWLKTHYRVTDEYVERRTGLLVRTYRSIRRDRIRTVEATARLRHRLAGLRVVTIGAGQHAVAGEPALVLDAVSCATAEDLRGLLLPREAEAAPQAEALETREVAATQEAGATPDAPAAPNAPATPEARAADAPVGEQEYARIDWSWTIYNVFNIWAFVLAAGVLWGVHWALQPFGVDPVVIVDALVDRWGAGWAIALGIGGAGLLGTIGLGVAFVTDNWNFRLTRVPGRDGTLLRTTRGLFTTREINRDDNRLRGLQISEPLLWRWLGIADTDVISTGLTIWSLEPATTILPRGPVEVARRVAAAVLRTDPSPFDAPLRPHPPAALRRRLLWSAALGGAAAILVAWAGTRLVASPWWLVGSGVVLLIALALGMASYRALGHTVVGEYLVTRFGIMAWCTAALRREAVVGWTFRQSPLQRRLGLMTVIATTAAGHGAYRAPDMAETEAIAFADEAVPELLRPFVER